MSSVFSEPGEPHVGGAELCSHPWGEERLPGQQILRTFSLTSVNTKNFFPGNTRLSSL